MTTANTGRQKAAVVEILSAEQQLVGSGLANGNFVKEISSGIRVT